MKRTPLNPPPLPDVEGIKKRRLKLDLLLKQQPELWPSVLDRCQRDPVFWAEQFCFIYDEHTTLDRKERALALWEFQKEMFLEIINNVLRCAKEENHRWNGAADKGRKMGA